MGRFRHLLLVCTNRRDRPDARGDCHGRGAVELLQALKEQAAQPPWRGQVRVVSCSCLGMCAQGCVVALFSAEGHGPAETWYSRLGAADAEDLFACHVRDEAPWQRRPAP